jgi:hypothetical protein
VNELLISQTQPRKVFMVLSPRSLAYAKCALESLFANSAEPLHLHLITDSIADRNALSETLNTLPAAVDHRWNVTAEDELNDTETSVFAGLPHLREFRRGHPCWRKVTDPLLLSAPGEEMILLDPDLYFPNRFRFEPTPAKGLVLMWQKPNCLLPPEVVQAAFNAGVPLARHVDIGVSHWRAGSDWAAIAMREGGGYLDPQRWVCWRRTQIKRARLKLGAQGNTILASEPWSQMKCFHAGGEAKSWVVPAVEQGIIAHGIVKQGATCLTPGRTLPFVELTRQRYESEQRAKRMLAGLGYYRLFQAGRA